jgi:hypothetical protein
MFDQAGIFRSFYQIGAFIVSAHQRSVIDTSS